jgi:acyl transferase domain-containing protein/thioester reductase-like protein/acyl carrier protein/ubiquinone/menaquinone biosynthesis C-methylase UbiE
VQELQAAGIKTTDVSLRGRFHSAAHQNDLPALLDFCGSRVEFQLPDAANLISPTRSNSSGKVIQEGKLHDIALRTILVEQSQWHQTFTELYDHHLRNRDTKILSFGPEKCIPASFLRDISSQVTNVSALEDSMKTIDYRESDIAVVGMSIKVAGADDLEEFWQILCEGKSQHQEVPESRFGFDTVFRDTDKKRKWFGNFIRDHDAFDHRFFKKSPREIATTDPQQRHMLQIAYQAVEQSGYFHNPDQEKHIGVYIGLCAADYENNIACHPPNAFSATGNLKSFNAGKISHYFGWTGPSLTIDTACSSSAVCIHQACQAILLGECDAALAGGTNIMTHPIWFQNLAGASFLSPTGQCKPFDAKADGYCRGEGIGAVFLKKVSKAIADGDQILGTIAATAVYQNQNCTPIFVPNDISLSELFRKVTDRAGLDPKQVTVVEAHGTGTPVGDPAEYSSIRSVFGGPMRSKPLRFGSVKGLVGHTEGTSGVVSLIKILLMMNEGKIPPQASFNSMSPGIHVNPDDNMEISTQVIPWDERYRAALINNYGACGSNASLVVTQTPRLGSASTQVYSSHSERVKLPFWFAALDSRSLQVYVSRLRQFVQSRTGSLTISNLAFNVYRQSNRNLPQRLMFTAESIKELDQNLNEFIKGNAPFVSTLKPATAFPVILCFGGQTSTFVGLDKEVYDNFHILHRHLDECDVVCQGIPGVGSIYPGIFQQTPIEDQVQLQTMLFALQYACAQSWVSCGVKPVALVGHSFGELTALCISQVLSLPDAVKLVAKRAFLIRESWGTESGAMMAIEGDLAVVEQLLVEAHKACPDEAAATIACYNAARSFTLAGSNKAIEAVHKTVAESPIFSGMRSKKLNVTNAFHSTLVESMIPGLESISKELTFNEPVIPVERATESETGSERDHLRFPAEHLRQPVYFYHAVKRLAQKYPSSIWLEAGSNSTITSMANRCLSREPGFTEMHFQSISITGKNTISSLSNATVKLWEAGLNTTFWAHHVGQTCSYSPILLPPYQFEKARHWMELKRPPRAIAAEPIASIPVQEELPKHLLTFVGYQDENRTRGRFRVNTMIEKYENFVSGHVVAQTSSIMPGTLQVDLAIEALQRLQPKSAGTKLEPQLRRLENQSPVCIDHSRQVWLDVEAADASGFLWSWKIVSNSVAGGLSNLHVSGQILLRSVEDKQFHQEFERLGRLISHDRCKQLLNNDDAADIIQGRNIYRSFASVVDYGETYRGLQKLVGKGTESAGRVVKPYVGETWLDTPVSDCFCQVAGIFVNCMTDHEPTEMFIATGAEQWIRSPKLLPGDARPEVWDVYATHRSSDKAWVSDVFIFDSGNGALLEVILGINYQKIPKLSMSRLLARLTQSSGKTASSSTPSTEVLIEPSNNANVKRIKKIVKKIVKKTASPGLPANIVQRVREVLAELVGLEPHGIAENAELADIGIDSLLGMEMAREIETKFSCTLDMDMLGEITDISSLMAVLRLALTGSSSENIETEEYEEAEVEIEEEVTEIENVVPVYLPTSATAAIPSQSQASVVAYLAELLGLSESEFEPQMLLLDLGIDSLLSTEVRHDVHEKFGREIHEDVAIEELTVQALETLINGDARPAFPPTPATEKSDMADGHTNGIHTNGVHMNAVHAAEGKASLNGGNTSLSDNLRLGLETVLEAFGEAKNKTDDFITKFGCADYMEQVLPKQNNFCIALVVEAFEKLGCSIKNATKGQTLARIPHIPKLERLADYLYSMLEKEARLIDINGTTITRTAVAPPSKPAAEILKDLLREFPDHTWANKLTFMTGSKMAECLTGEQDGIKLIFGTPEGKELVTGLYGQSLLNLLSVRQMEDFLGRLITRLPPHSGPLKILEMGAGTGGFTAGIIPMLASCSISIEYTFTDLAPSMVAQARKRFKEYPFMTFRTLDIEQVPPADLVNSQHVVVAHNCIHATHSLIRSVANAHRVLRPDGFLLMLEMTNPLYWVDMIFGIFEGWWLFDDGRKHAIAHQTVWQQALQSVGFAHVDWTDGYRPEVEIQRVIIAMASGPKQNILPLSPAPVPVKQLVEDTETRQTRADVYISQFVSGFNVPTPSLSLAPAPKNDNHVVLITGATGSLGSHLVAHLASLPQVTTVVCINRRSNESDPALRQKRALEQRGVALDASVMHKLLVFETDTSKPLLGLSSDTYNNLMHTVTHIVHNAWPMSGKRSVKGFETQFIVMRNLVNLASDISSNRVIERPISFQFISSISVVGHYPLWSGKPTVPEQRVTMKSVLNNGYSEAKYVCECMLDETLNKYPDVFRPMAVRLGQVAGSSTSGYWNPVEHFPFILKSSQTLDALPDFRGALSWTPVDTVAATLGDILLADQYSSYPIYHIDNPVRQPWEDMIPVLANAMGIRNVISFKEWVRRVRHFPGSVEHDNPAAKLIEFLDDNFLRMSCGGLLLDTTQSQEHSGTLRGIGPVSVEVTQKYVNSWKQMGFLH